ncbi:3-oxoacyl-ACP synthase [Actinoallomurus acanthiterrae]
MSFGLTAFGHALPATVPIDGTAHGYRSYHRADPGVGATDLAVEAGEQALRNARTDPDDVDLLVLALSDIPEYLYWDAAASVQARLRAHRAETMLISQACGGGVMSFDAVAGKFATHPDYGMALLIGTNRVCEQYWDRWKSTTSLGSDGAAAAVARRGHGSCRWLVTEAISDGRYADFMRMEAGGAAKPFGAHGDAPAKVPMLIDRIDGFFAGSARAALEFADLSSRRNGEVFRRACARAGVVPDAVARVLYLHDNANAFLDLSKELGMPLERTNRDLAAEYGHLGSADQLLSLERLLRDGELRSGDVVALMSQGSGMHWTCTLLEI